MAEHIETESGGYLGESGIRHHVHGEIALRLAVGDSEVLICLPRAIKHAVRFTCPEA